METDKIKEIEEKAKSIPNSGGPVAESKSEKKKPGRRPMTEEQRAQKAAEKAAGLSGAGGARPTDPAKKVVIDEARVNQAAQFLKVPAKMVSGLAVTWTKSSKAAMKPEKMDGICHAWAMILELYFPDFLNDPKILALITASFVTGEYVMQVYAVKQLIEMGELQPDQIPVDRKAGKSDNPPAQSAANIAIVPQTPEPPPFAN